MKFIIEHLEKKLYEWCMIEYEHISKIVGKKSLIFTNTREKKLDRFGSIEPRSATKLKLKNACLLDPKSEKELTPKEAKIFDYFIFGGILGDYPEQGRTEKCLTSKMNVEKRNLGSKQMSTDTAVLVTKMIIHGKKLDEINFIDEPTITLKRGKVQEEINLPYRYVAKNNKPVISGKLLKYLKQKKDL